MKKRIFVAALISYAAIIFLSAMPTEAEEITLTSVEVETRNTIAAEAYRLYKRGDFEQAVEFARAAYEIDTEDTLSIANLAALYVTLNDMQQAAPLLEKLQSRKNEICSKFAEVERKYASYKKRWESSQKLTLSSEEMKAHAELQELGQRCNRCLSLLDDAQAGTMQNSGNRQATR